MNEIPDVMKEKGGALEFRKELRWRKSKILVLVTGYKTARTCESAVSKPHRT
jgi:hypothetical protein